MEANKEQKLSHEQIFSGGLLLSVFLTVCAINTSLWRGVITAKYFYFTIVIFVAMTVYTFLHFRHKQLFLSIRIADIATVVLISYMVAHRFFIDGGKNMQWQLLLLMIPLYVLIRAISEKDKGIDILTNTILISVLAQSIWGIFQLLRIVPSYHNVFHITGSFFNPAPYGGFVAAGIPLSLGLLFSKKRAKWEHILGGSVLITTLIILPFTESRAAWLAFLAGVLAVAWMKRNMLLNTSLFRRFKQKKAILTLTMIFCLAVVMSFLYGMYHFKKDSADGRLLIWEVSISIIKENPFVGSGTGNYTSVYGQMQGDFFASGKGDTTQMQVADYPEYAFNEGIHIAVELGLVGLILFIIILSLCVSPFLRIEFSERNKLVSYYVPSLLALLIFSLFSYPFDVLPHTILFTTFLAVTASETTKISRQPKYHWHVAIWLSCVLLITSVMFQVLPLRQSYQRWQEACVLFRSGDFVNAVDEYHSLYEQLKYEEKFMLEYAKCLSHLEQYEASNQIIYEYIATGSDPEAYNYLGNNYKALQQYDKAESAYIRSTEIVPNRHYPHYLLMKLYLENGNMEKAKEKARLLRDKPVKIDSKIISLIKREALKILEEERDEVEPIKH